MHKSELFLGLLLTPAFFGLLRVLGPPDLLLVGIDFSCVKSSSVVLLLDSFPGRFVATPWPPLLLL